MENAVILAKQTAIMFVLILFGVFLYKKKIFTKEGGGQLSNFVVTAVSPVLIFTSFQKEMDERLINGLLLSFLMAFISYAVMILAATLFFREKSRGEDYAVERFAAIYSNCAFLGIPLVNAVYGSDGVFFVTAFIAVFNLLSWTHGVMVMTGKMDARSLLNIIKAPSVIAVFIGVICFFCGFILHETVLEPLDYIASLNTPLAMIVSGITIAQSDIRKAIKNSGIYITCAFKLIIGPLLVMLAFLPFSGADKTVVNTMIIAASAPTAATTIMFSGKFGRNSVYASEIFAVSTLASIITLPLILTIAEKIL